MIIVLDPDRVEADLAARAGCHVRVVAARYGHGHGHGDGGSVSSTGRPGWCGHGGPAAVRAAAPRCCCPPIWYPDVRMAPR